jgi:hypothetical protein
MAVKGGCQWGGRGAEGAKWGTRIACHGERWPGFVEFAHSAQFRQCIYHKFIYICTLFVDTLHLSAVY